MSASGSVRSVASNSIYSELADEPEPVVLARPTRTPTSRTTAGGKRGDHDWADADELFPDADANPFDEPPVAGNRSSYPAVPRIDLVPQSPCSSRSSTVSSRGSTLPRPEKGKHRESDPLPGPSRPPSPASRLADATRTIFAEYAEVHSLAQADSRVIPLAYQLGLVAEMVSEKADADIADAVALLSRQITVFTQNAKDRDTVSPSRIESVGEADAILEVAWEDPARAREAIRRLVAERDEAIARLATLVVPDRPASLSPIPERPGSLSPIPSPRMSRAPSPYLAADGMVPTERSVSLGITSDPAPEPVDAEPIDLTFGMTDEELAYLANDQERIMQTIRFEQVARERQPQPPRAPKPPVAAVSGAKRPAPPPAPPSEKPKFGNIFKKALNVANPTSSSTNAPQASAPAPAPRPVAVAPSSAPIPPPRTSTSSTTSASRSALTFEQALQNLYEMGFDDTTRNVEVLRRCGGDFGRVLEELLAVRVVA